MRPARARDDFRSLANLEAYCAGLLSLCALLVASPVFAARPDASKSQASAPANTASTAAASTTVPNRETELIERRSTRLKELPRPTAPPAVAGIEHPIDRFVISSWPSAPAASVEPKPCDDATFVRRAYLDLIGVIPTAVELNKFLVDSSAGKREKLIDQLLARSADYAAHWAPFWEDALASQVVLAQGGIPTRGNYRQWIVQSFEQNRPYDVMLAELLDPTMPGRKETDTENILGVKYTIEYVRNEDPEATLQTAANVGQVFLGTSMKCASCHDHFENHEWTQDRFLGFAGLFAERDLERVRCEVHSGRFIPARFPFDLPGKAQPVPNDVAGRLHFLAQSITDPANPRFAKTIVNRLWKRYLGLGLVEPADDFRLDVPASQPELLDWLAYDFLEHGCDLKHTIRLILTSRTYQLAYDPRLEDHFELGSRMAPRFYRSPSLRRLSAEQITDSMRLAITGELGPDERSYLDPRSTALTRALGRPASRNEVSTSRPDDLAVLQSLELLNGQDFHEQIYASILGGPSLVRQEPTRIVDRLYRSVLSRPATLDEKRLGKAFLVTSPAIADALRDMLWALFVSPEFQYIK
jgi:hypothetical protein